MRRARRVRCAHAARLAAALAFGCLGGCSSAPDPLDVQGIELSADGVFRGIEVEGQSAERAFAAARQVLRLRFAGGRLVENVAERSIEVMPRGFQAAPRRVAVFLKVGEGARGARVEVFCKVDELRDDPGEDLENPWRFIGRDAVLENRLLHEIWDLLVIVPAPEP